MARILVTGERGFIGGYVAAYLVNLGHEVVFPVERLEYIHRIRGDEPFDCIFHAAAAGPWCTPDQIFASNFAGMRALVRAAANWTLKSFIFCSSISVYGRIEAPVVDEATPSIGPDLYGISKLYGERLLRDAGVPAFNLRLPGVVGPGVRGRNWLPQLARNIRDGRPLEIANLDLPFNNVVHVADLAITVEALAARGQNGATLVLGSRDALTVREVAECIARTMDRPVLFREIGASKPHFTIDASTAYERGVWTPMPIRVLLTCFAQEVADEPA